MLLPGKWLSNIRKEDKKMANKYDHLFISEQTLKSRRSAPAGIGFLDGKSLKAATATT